MSRIRKNKKFIDPRYFMDEKMEVLSDNLFLENLSPELLKLANDPVLKQMWTALMGVTRSQGAREKKVQGFMEMIELIKKEKPDLIQHPTGQARIYSHGGGTEK